METLEVSVGAATGLHMTRQVGHLTPQEALSTRVAMATYYLSSQSRGGESRLGATAVTGQPEDAFLISAASVLGY